MTIKHVNIILFQRYYGLINNNYKEVLERVKDMCYYATHNDMLEDKQSRWLGFVQGVLYSNGIICINEERNISRKLFHQAYNDLGIPIPKTVNLEVKK